MGCVQWNIGANVWNSHFPDGEHMPKDTPPPKHKSHSAEFQTIDSASFKMVTAAILNLKVRTDLYYKTDIKIEFPHPIIPHKSQITPHCMPRKHCIFESSFRLFVRLDRFLKILWGTLIRNGLKYDMLVHYEHLHSQLDIGHGVLSVVILGKIWLSEIC